MTTSTSRHSHRHRSALSAVPSPSLSASTSRTSSVFSITDTTISPSHRHSFSSSSPRSLSTQGRHPSIEKAQSPSTPNEQLSSSIALDHHLACSSSFFALANGGRMTPTLLPPPPPPPQRWDDSQLALDLADDTIILPYNTSMPSYSSRQTIKTKMRQWIIPLKRKQRFTQWLSDKRA